MTRLKENSHRQPFIRTGIGQHIFHSLISPREQRNVIEADDAGDPVLGDVVDDEVAVAVVLARGLGAETVAGAQHPSEIHRRAVLKLSHKTRITSSFSCIWLAVETVPLSPSINYDYSYPTSVRTTSKQTNNRSPI